MTDQELLATAGDFAIAILLGALIGIEREKRKSEDDDDLDELLDDDATADASDSPASDRPPGQRR